MSSNTFVDTAIDLLRANPNVTTAELQKEIADCEPKLSGLNVECVAREALRMWPSIKAADEAAREEA
jgi:hypothetical protein